MAGSVDEPDRAKNASPASQAESDAHADSAPAEEEALDLTAEIIP